MLKLIHEDWEKNPAKVEEIGDQVQATLSRANDNQWQASKRVEDHAGKLAGNGA
jgi:hypothetical protein